MQQDKNLYIMTVQQLLDEGLHCYHNKNFEEALFCFEKLLNIASDNTELLHTIVKLLQEMEDFDKASFYGEQLLALSPENENFLLLQAENYFHINNYKMALPIYLRLHELHPASIHLLERLITIYQKKYDFTDKEIEFSAKKNKHDSPTTIDVALALSSFFLNKNILNETKLLLESILLIESENMEACGLYGVYLEKIEDYNKAFFYLDKAVNCSYFKYLTILTKCIENVFGLVAVVYYLEELIKKHPEDELNKKLLGLFYYKKGDYAAANDIFSVLSDENEDKLQFKYRVLSRFIVIFEKDNVIEKNELISVANDLFNLYKKLPQDKEVISNLMKFYLHMGEFEKAYDLCQALDKDIPNNKTNTWNKHMYFLVKRNRDDFFKSYISGRHVRLKTSLESIANKIWNGENIEGKRVVILREQGIGDEILFASNYDWIIEQASHVDIYCSPRLTDLFSEIFTTAHFHSVVENEIFKVTELCVQECISLADKVILAGDLPSFYYKKMAKPLYKENYFKLADNNNFIWQKKLTNLIADNTPKIGLIWRSGFFNGARATSYLNNDEVAYVLSSIPEAEFINCMYIECEQELKEIEKLSGRKIYRLDDLDQKNDFRNTAAMLSNLDLLFGAYTTTLSLSAAVGTPVVAYSADYLKQDKKLKKEALYYSSNVSHISLPLNDSAKRKEAINLIIDEIKKVLQLNADLVNNL